MDAYTIGKAAWWASWVLAGYGALRLGYDVLSWLDRCFYGRPRIVRRRVAGSGYVWGRARAGDGKAPDYVTTGGVRVDAETFARMYRRRPRSEPVEVIDVFHIHPALIHAGLRALPAQTDDYAEGCDDDA
jgi:hypothetical protein